MLRRRVAALAACGHSPRPHLGPKLNDRDKTVAARAIHPFRSFIVNGAERGDRAPVPGRKSDGLARAAVREWMNDVIRDALETIYLAPRCFPGAEIRSQAV